MLSKLRAMLPSQRFPACSTRLTLVLIWSIPAAITYTFGKMVGNTKQGWSILAAMRSPEAYKEETTWEARSASSAPT